MTEELSHQERWTRVLVGLRLRGWSSEECADLTETIGLVEPLMLVAYEQLLVRDHSDTVDILRANISTARRLEQERMISP